MLLSGGEETGANGQVCVCVGGGGPGRRVVCSLPKGKNRECGTDRGVWQVNWREQITYYWFYFWLLFKASIIHFKL